MFSQRMLNAVRQMIEAYLARWQDDISTGAAQLPAQSLPSGGDTGDGFTPAPHGHEQFYDAHEFWGRPISNAVPTDGQAFIWSTAESMFVLEQAGGGGSGVGFRARLGSDTVINGAFPILTMSDEHYDSGDLYDTINSRWVPPAGPVTLIFRLRVSSQVGELIVVLMKNSSEIYRRTGGAYSHDGDDWMEAAYQDLADGDDYYQIAATVASGTLLASDTWWAGMTGGGGGGSGGGGGPTVPAPFVYITDSDGVLLVDADGRFLYEDL